MIETVAIAVVCTLALACAYKVGVIIALRRLVNHNIQGPGTTQKSGPTDRMDTGRPSVVLIQETSGEAWTMGSAHEGLRLEAAGSWWDRLPRALTLYLDQGTAGDVDVRFNGFSRSRCSRCGHLAREHLVEGIESGDKLRRGRVMWCPPGTGTDPGAPDPDPANLEVVASPETTPCVCGHMIRDHLPRADKEQWDARKACAWCNCQHTRAELIHAVKTGSAIEPNVGTWKDLKSRTLREEAERRAPKCSRCGHLRAKHATDRGCLVTGCGCLDCPRCGVGLPNHGLGCPEAPNYPRPNPPDPVMG